MNFSLVFATRSRVDLVEGLFKSLIETTSNPELIEIIPVIDDDDEETNQAVDYLSSLLPNVSFRRRPRSKKLNEDYINWGARNSNGKFIFILNDDVAFKIKDWDIKCFEKLNLYLSDKSDGIVYGLTDDGMDELRIQQKLQYSGFPIISRQSLDALGYAMHPSFSGWGADIDLFSLYNSIGRICDLKSEVLAFHISPHTNSRERDEINKHVANISSNHRSAPDLSKDINKLKSYIYSKNPKGLPTTQNSVTEKKAEVKPPNPPMKNFAADRYIHRISSIRKK